MGIVVGIDGSKGSRTALEWALAEARLRQATLTALTVWSPVVTGYLPSPAPFVDPELERQTVAGSAARALIAESENADLVVVGSRGHGGFAGLLLGSVSEQVGHHAQCPVVIVPGA